jgi:DNA-binding GntR family transcriptional regulator
MPPTNAPILAEQLAGQIVEHVQTERLERGARLTERHLAALLNVSRSPVRGALQLLEKRGLVRRDSDGGYFTARSPSRIRLVHKPIISKEETLYLQIAEDRLSGRIPEKVTENSLIRTYKATRGEIVRILRRAAEEGWAERHAGHGWSFLPVLTSPEVYQQSYRFRMLIEPQGILEPTFQLNRAALLRSREQQQMMIDGNGLRLSPAALFVIGSRFHETLIRCSGNSFLIDALERINRLRRLIEYRKLVDRASWLKRCREHIQLVDILLEGNREAASEFLRNHLEAGAKAKVEDRL